MDERIDRGIMDLVLVGLALKLKDVLNWFQENYDYDEMGHSELSLYHSIHHELCKYDKVIIECRDRIRVELMPGVLEEEAEEAEKAEKAEKRRSPAGRRKTD